MLQFPDGTGEITCLHVDCVSKDGTTISQKEISSFENTVYRYMHFFLISEEYGPLEDEDDDDVNEAVQAEIATVLRAYVEDMSPQQRMILKEAVREKLQELEEEEEMQNEIEEGAYIFNSYLSKIVETMTIKNLSIKQDQKSM